MAWNAGDYPRRFVPLFRAVKERPKGQSRKYPLCVQGRDMEKLYEIAKGCIQKYRCK